MLKVTKGFARGKRGSGALSLKQRVDSATKRMKIHQTVCDENRKPAVAIVYDGMNM